MEIINMKLKMMATLWDNTYRVAIDDGQGKYIGTARVVGMFHYHQKCYQKMHRK